MQFADDAAVAAAVHGDHARPDVIGTAVWQDQCRKHDVDASIRRSAVGLVRPQETCARRDEEIRSCQAVIDIGADLRHDLPRNGCVDSRKEHCRDQRPRL